MNIVTKQSVGLNNHNPQYHWGLYISFNSHNPLGLNYLLDSSTLTGCGRIYFLPPISLGVM